MYGWLDGFLGAKEEETYVLLWRRRAVFLIAFGYAVVAVLIAIIATSLNGLQPSIVICPITLSVYASSVWVLNRGGSTMTAAMILLISSSLGTLGFVLASGGLFGPGAVLFIGGPMAGALLIGMRGAIGAGVVTGAITLLLYAYGPGVIVNAKSIVHVTIQLVALISFTLFSVAITRMTNAILNDALRARDDANKANRSKSDFLANMSHEIRTPLNGVIALAESLSQDELSDESRKKTQVIQNSGEILLRIINDILDVSKMEAGAIEVEQRPFDLGALVSHLDSLYRPTANERGLAFEVGIDSNLKVWRTGDEHRLSQISSNLISNAIKFTRQGSIKVRFEPSGRGIRLIVADTGRGMEPEQAERVFCPFVQADSSTTRQFGGTGLGLSIVRGLTDRMGGDVSLETAMGEGTTFTVDLPFPEATVTGAKESTRAKRSLAQAPSLHDCRVLIVDDSSVNLMVLATLFKPTGASVVQAADGPQSIEFSEEQAFDVILMDISMPGMDGREATRTIRETCPLNRDTPIIATTAHALDHEVKDLMAEGFDDHLAKPISSARLFEVVITHLELASYAAGEANEEPSAAQAVS
ncbi:MAG: ATP-binding protein [Pseudomonadota bacterium]